MSRPREGLVRERPSTGNCCPKRIRERHFGRRRSTDVDNLVGIHRVLEVQAVARSRPQKGVPATGPLASFSVTRDGDIAPGSRNEAHTLFDHRVEPSARSTSWELK